MKAYLALGSNLEDPVSQLKKALSHIEKISQTQILKISPFYKNPPMGPQNQDDFVNAVIELETDLDVKPLLYAFQAIEQKMGRVRLERWGARIIDLDLLLFDNLVFQDHELTLPHPGIYDRIFFLKPLHDIAPDLLLFKPELIAILNNDRAKMQVLVDDQVLQTLS
ncbi:MAG: 2-amino-4-hydroxy-6-hydroxymethyldihydropteridine diphosphokinase [Legionellales bacterium]